MECQLYVQHVIALNEHYLAEDSLLTRYRPNAEFIKLMCHTAWYVDSDHCAGLVVKALISDRYLFEIADYEILDRILQGGLRACEGLADENFQPSVKACLYHISGTVNTSKGYFRASEEDLLKALHIRRNLKPSLEDDTATTLNNLGVLYNSMRKHDKAQHCLDESLAIQQKRDASEDRDMSINMAQHNVARNAFHKGEIEFARPLLEQQLEFYRTRSSWWMKAQ